MRAKPLRYLLGGVIAYFLIYHSIGLLLSFRNYGSYPKPRVFVAANFYNNEEILPNFSTQLLSLIKFLGKENIFVSIYENGSKDNTKALLKGLEKKLLDLGVEQHIETNEASKSFFRRIPYLAKLRNIVIQPLITQYEKGVTYDKLIFFNDVVFHFGDLLELLYTNNLQYDAVCPMDYYYQFYDNFATRDQDGNPFGSGYFPYTEHGPSKRLLWKKEPFPVFSCWNGMVAFNPEPFLRGVQFRALEPDINGLAEEASECCLVYVDFRSLNFNKIYINPRVKVTYHWRFYYLQKLLGLADPFLYFLNYPSSEAFRSNLEKNRQHIPAQFRRKLNGTEEERKCVQ